jgi:hypothetical protein
MTSQYRRPQSTIFSLFHYLVSRVAQSVECLATGWTTGRSRFDPRQRRKDFSSSLCVQNGSGAHPTSCTMGTVGPLPRAKARHGRDADHSPHLAPRSRMSGTYTSSPPSAFMASNWADLALASPISFRSKSFNI